MPFGVMTGDERWWWNGYDWLEMPTTDSPEVRRTWPPKGFYWRPTDGRRTYWTGSAWSVSFWRPWRAFATVAVLIIGGLVFLIGGIGQMGDPAAGVNTPAIDTTRRLWAAAALAGIPVTIALVLLLNWHSLRSPIRRTKRARRHGTN